MMSVSPRFAWYKTQKELVMPTVDPNAVILRFLPAFGDGLKRNIVAAYAPHGGEVTYCSRVTASHACTTLARTVRRRRAATSLRAATPHDPPCLGRRPWLRSLGCCVGLCWRTLAWSLGLSTS